ncbi:hypothetical protein [Commensalibacter nepenthis]|uniref:Uncharacterized protein n=1 Tax=Commensalibacter nepenthis TaxID=3043872 RepID=A0ABT6Q5M0_9PROT|nr:hypothetical protein [Commensalibacter sp. TBRC 10068]MDI2112195.1 hypothetical protein [Commensalibacter sp. TBRC 10068]
MHLFNLLELPTTMLKPFTFLQPTTHTELINNVTIEDSDTNLTLGDDNYHMVFGNG